MYTAKEWNTTGIFISWLLDLFIRLLYRLDWIGMYVLGKRIVVIAA